MGFQLRVEEVRQEKGISMSELSRLSGIDFKTVKELCRNPERNTTLETMARLALTLGVTLDDLVKITPDDDSPARP
jgi:transcriptional regulator with XRE-family HTH domain